MMPCANQYTFVERGTTEVVRRLKKASIEPFVDTVVLAVVEAARLPRQEGVVKDCDDSTVVDARVSEAFMSWEIG